MLGTWCLVLGAWCLVLGIWYLILGAWCLVLDWEQHYDITTNELNLQIPNPKFQSMRNENPKSEIPNSKQPTLTLRQMRI